MIGESPFVEPTRLLGMSALKFVDTTIRGPDKTIEFSLSTSQSRALTPCLTSVTGPRYESGAQQYAAYVPAAKQLLKKISSKDVARDLPSSGAGVGSKADVDSVPTAVPAEQSSVPPSTTASQSPVPPGKPSAQSPGAPAEHSSVPPVSLGTSAARAKSPRPRDEPEPRGRSKKKRKGQGPLSFSVDEPDE